MCHNPSGLMLVLTHCHLLHGLGADAVAGAQRGRKAASATDAWMQEEANRRWEQSQRHAHPWGVRWVVVQVPGGGGQ